MPKNLLFLSDKLPKPNYDKQFKSSNSNEINIEEAHNYRSYNRVKNNENQNGNIKDQVENKDFKKGIHIRKQIKLAPLQNIPELKKMPKLNSNLIENNKIDIYKVGLNNSHSTNDINNTNAKSQERNNSLNNINQININKSSGNNSNILNNKIKLKKDEMYYIDFLSKQKNDLKKLMLKNSNIIRKIGYHNNSQINASPIKDINKMFILNMNNKSAPKKLNNKIILNI